MLVLGVVYIAGGGGSYNGGNNPGDIYIPTTAFDIPSSSQNRWPVMCWSGTTQGHGYATAVNDTNGEISIQLYGGGNPGGGLLGSSWQYVTISGQFRIV